MGSLVSLLLTVVFGLGILVAGLLALYGLASLLPGRWRERARQQEAHCVSGPESWVNPAIDLIEALDNIAAESQ